ncbi:MAG TPA: glycosyltransferase family 4 protein [Pseudomonadales bacterium]|nr:glycosyltransferase family 4 protein [Pseudomonadales bacterium]
MIPSLVIAFVVTVMLGTLFIRRRDGAWMDQPSERSLHQVPVPRSGGIAICCGMAAGAWFLRSVLEGLFDPFLLVAALVLWLVSVLDDWKSLGQLPRLFCQIAAACLGVFVGGLYFSVPGLPWLWPTVGVLVILWGINLYNFMDGMDGFAAGMAILGFSTLAILGSFRHDTAFVGLCLLVVASNLGFLVLNFPPARIFMGDSGSTVTGFLMVTCSLLGWKRNLYPAWAPLVIFSPFWVDATLTLLKRALRGDRIWQAHREHYYQRWVLAGFGHRRIVLAEYCLMAVCSGEVLAWQVTGAGYNGIAVLVGSVVLYISLILWSDRVLAKTPAAEKNQ